MWRAAARLITAVVVAALVVSALVAGSAALVGLFAHRTISSAWQSLPSLPEELDRSALRSTMLAADGSELAELHAGINRTPIVLEQVPSHVIAAVTSTEDRRYFEHSGVDLRGIARAALSNFRSGKVSQGGSTLTQQTVKNLVLDDSEASQRNLRRKVVEAKLAWELESRYTKDQILELYLSEAYLGQGVYGIGAASEYYFSSTVEQLSVPQAALLAGMLRSPEGNNPVSAPENALKRRNIVLHQMGEAGALSPREVARFQAAPVVLNLSPIAPPRFPHLSGWALKELRNLEVLGTDPEMAARKVFEGGLTIHTSVDPAMQEHAEQVIADTVSDVEADPSIAAVVYDPQTGRVPALAIGPKPYGTCPADQACARSTVNPFVAGFGGSGRQPGSVFKPIVSATSLSLGIPSTVRYESAGGAPVPGCGEWEPSNYAPARGRIDLAAATRVSNNVYFARLIGEVGPSAVRERAAAMGIRSELAADCTISLGSASVYGVDLAAAYGTFAAGGMTCTPHLVTAVYDRDGELLWSDDELGCARGLDEGVAATVTRTLQEPPRSGTAAGMDRAFAPVPVAGKTGTATDHRDAWFAGYTAPSDPATGEGSLVGVVWVGFDQPRPLENVLGLARVTGGSVPASVFTRLIAPLAAERPVGRFPTPPSEVVQVPEVRGRAEAVGLAALQRTKLRPEVQRVSHWLPAGTVVDLRPGVGSRVPYLSAVVVEVSDGSVASRHVPDVVGYHRTTAASVLAGTDPSWVVRFRGVFSTAHPVGAVLSQTPAAGSRLGPGATIVLTVVVAPAPPRPAPLAPVTPPAPTPGPAPEPTLPDVPEPPAVPPSRPPEIEPQPEPPQPPSGGDPDPDPAPPPSLIPPAPTP
jgi:membrane peptidoglycan carboxypeptidase